MKGEGHLFLMIIFVVAMFIWLIFGIIEGTSEGTWYRRGSGLLAWISVAILGYLMLA